MSAYPRAAANLSQATYLMHRINGTWHPCAKSSPLPLGARTTKVT
jgi:hypothetical protein